MAQRPISGRNPGESAQRWLTGLHNRIPLAGGWLRTQSALQLVRLSLAGDVLATRILAQALDNHNDASIRQMIRRHLSSPLPSAALHAAWQVWAETRHPQLAAVLITQNRPAIRPPRLAAYSALLLNQEQPLIDATPDWIPSLVDACADPDAALSSRARYALVHLSRPESVAALCQLWVETRNRMLEDTLAQAAYQPMQPAAVSIMVALKFNRLELITRRGPDVLQPLITACTDGDEDIHARARFCLGNLLSQPAVNALCATWLEKRIPLLEEAILRARYVASQPARVRLYSALLSGRVEIAEKASPDGVNVLLEASGDSHSELAARAATALRALRLPEAREGVCRAVIEQDSALARQICVEMGYLPAQPEQRALFFFLTGQWEDYETLDFDQRLLNAVYQTSSAEIRQRILRRVQQAGRTDFLNIVSSSDDRARAARMTAIEAQLFVRVLAANQEWERLWGLAQALALPLSVEIVRMLSAQNWHPSGDLDHEIFTRLVELSRGALLYTGAELTAALPLAVQRALLRIHGRVNSIAIAPNAPHLAIGTGGARVAAWDYHTAGINNLWKDFAHSIGEVTYTPNGTLLCAERSSNPAPCAVYALRDDTFHRVGSHNASVTVLEALDDNTIFTAGRDGVATVWDIAHNSQMRRRVLDDWPRAACLSTDRARILLLHNRLAMLDARTLEPLPELSLARLGQAGRSVLRCAAFLPEGAQVLAGQFNGQVIAYQDGRSRSRARLVTEHAKTVESVLVVPRRPLAVTAGAEGELRFFSLPDLVQLAALKTPGSRLTSLHASPDGAFLATGANDSTLALWDLRVQDIPTLFNTPAANVMPNQMALINTLVSYGAGLPTAVQAALRYLQTLLAHRFRFDIEVSEVATIQVGEFDVFLD